MTTSRMEVQMADSGSCLCRTALGLTLLVATLSPASGLLDRSHDQDNAAQRMDQFVSQRDFSGVVLVARDGHVLFQKAYGLANREHDVPVRAGHGELELGAKPVTSAFRQSKADVQVLADVGS